MQLKKKCIYIKQYDKQIKQVYSLFVYYTTPLLCLCCANRKNVFELYDETTANFK